MTGRRQNERVPLHSDRRSPHLRETDWGGDDVGTVSDLVRAYLVQTESEKRKHGLRQTSVSGAALPERYEREVRDPRTAYAGCTTFLAEFDDRPAGVVIVRTHGGVSEITRLWADPELRGRGIGSALLDAALSRTRDAVRLSVWEWRTAAIRLYESRGFERVASWDDRPGLVCMLRSSRSDRLAR
nr:GNAT family N-acetyltransferase [Microbacterium hydrocarbonoxydans]